MLVSSHLQILCRCAKETSFTAYFGTFDWINLLTPIIHSCYPEIQVPGFFLCGYLSPSLPNSCADLWKLSTSSVDLVMSLLCAASKRSDLTTVFFDLKISYIDLITSLQVLINNHSVNAELVSSSDKIIPLCRRMLAKDQVVEKKATCVLLWNLLENHAFKQLVTQSILDLLLVLNESEDVDVKCLAKCVLMAMQEVDIEGDHKLIVHCSLIFIGC